jgi:hypothetical protein
MIESSKTLWKTKFGESTEVEDPDSFDGRLARMMAEMKYRLGQMAVVSKNSLDPTTTSGVMAENLVQFNGITINGQEFSTVVMTFKAKDGHSCDVPADFVVATSTGVSFKVDSAVSLTPGETNTSISATCTLPGPYTAGAGEITETPTALYGLDYVTNAAAAVPGDYKESYPRLRARRWRTAVGVGMHHPSKIKSALENLPNVTAAQVEVNNTAANLPSGVPPQHVRAIVKGGTDQDIADCLFGTYAPYNGAGSVAAGIGTWGSEVVLPTGSMDASNTIQFDRNQDVNIYISMVIRKIGGKFPGNGISRIKELIIELFQGDLEIEGETLPRFDLGDDIYGTKIAAAAAGVVGHNVISCFVGTSANPTATYLEMAIHQWAQTAENLIDVSFG